MGLVVDGLKDLGTHFNALIGILLKWCTLCKETHMWHPPQICLQGRMTSQREREPGIKIGLGLFGDIKCTL